MWDVTSKNIPNFDRMPPAAPARGWDTFALDLEILPGGRKEAGVHYLACGLCVDGPSCPDNVLATSMANDNPLRLLVGASAIGFQR